MTPSDCTGSDLLFVDTNVFLRFLTNDVPEQADAAEALFRRAAAGEVGLVTNTIVVAEIVWVLESYYRLTRPDVMERALAVAHMDGLALPESDIITEALLEYAESNVDFIDAYNAGWIRHRGLRRIATFDQKHYSRFEGLAIQMPGAD
ncbi:MAG: PIN domain-containing protein [Actinobacteria bacterium]|nr:PIN domain-containing protein [Actinomycetota bacterium]